MTTRIAVRGVWDVRDRTEFPTLCEVCGIAKVFGTLTERTSFETEHQHGGTD